MGKILLDVPTSEYYQVTNDIHDLLRKLRKRDKDHFNLGKIAAKKLAQQVGDMIERNRTSRRNQRESYDRFIRLIDPLLVSLSRPDLTFKMISHIGTIAGSLMYLSNSTNRLTLALDILTHPKRYSIRDRLGAAAVVRQVGSSCVTLPRGPGGLEDMIPPLLNSWSTALHLTIDQYESEDNISGVGLFGTRCVAGCLELVDVLARHRPDYLGTCLDKAISAVTHAVKCFAAHRDLDRSAIMLRLPTVLRLFSISHSSETWVQIVDATQSILRVRGRHVYLFGDDDAQSHLLNLIPIVSHLSVGDPQVDWFLFSLSVLCSRMVSKPAWHSMQLPLLGSVLLTVMEQIAHFRHRQSHLDPSLSYLLTSWGTIVRYLDEVTWPQKQSSSREAKRRWQVEVDALLAFCRTLINILEDPDHNLWKCAALMPTEPPLGVSSARSGTKFSMKKEIQRRCAELFLRLLKDSPVEEDLQGRGFGTRQREAASGHADLRKRAVNALIDERDAWSPADVEESDESVSGQEEEVQLSDSEEEPPRKRQRREV